MLKIERLTKYIDGKLIFKDISCAINDQHLLISGESGCGKSTLAKIIAGLDMNYQGDLYFNGHYVSHIRQRMDETHSICASVST